MNLNETILSGKNVQAADAGVIGELNRKMAELIKETNQFTYIVTHDLQAPLRMISGFLELIEKRYAGQLDEAGKQYIGYAMKGSAKMKSLIFDLLEYSRLSSVEHVFEQTDLNEILKTVTAEMMPEITRTGVLIGSGPLPVLQSDKKLMTLLFRHLLDNAVKFRNAEMPEIKIAAENHNGSWELTFQDNGIGIDNAFLEKIFVIFRRLQTDESKYPGTGTGLAVCKKIAEIHGGFIRAESVPGEGTVIRVRLATCDNLIQSF